MNNPSTIERNVMRRIGVIRAVRPLLTVGALASVVLVVALWAIGRDVWVARVFENAPHNVTALPAFYLAAFAHTKVVVQVLSLITLASLITIARKAAGLISGAAIPARAH
ncbi:MAG: hypothetical protein JWN18_671 [Parcubacteria group bacterium]|nr:hypothetical protein [Parcubacteria group bacterium]